MKKSLMILWLVGIFVLCLAASYLVGMKLHPYSPSKEILILTFATAGGIFIILGIISWVVYYFVKRSGNAIPAKIGLWVFTGLAAAGIAGSFQDGIKGIEKRKLHFFREEFKKGFMESCISQGKTSLGTALADEGIKDPDAKVKNYCDCVYSKMEMDDELMDTMMDESVPVEEVLNSKKVIKMATECAMDIFKFD